MRNGRKKVKAPKSAGMVSPWCPRCGHRHTIRSGYIQGEQRWKCKACAYQYTRLAPRGRPLWQKSLVVFLYSYGVSLHAIARIFHVQPSTVLKWVRSYARDHTGAPEKGQVLFMDLEDMRLHLKHAASSELPTLWIAINDELFKKSLGITIESRD